jgi:hypothetical protein
MDKARLKDVPFFSSITKKELAEFFVIDDGKAEAPA